MPTDLVQRINLDLLYPPFLELVLKILDECRTKGRDYYLVSGFRSPEEQLALWQKGRSAQGAVVRPKDVVTNVRFGAHNTGAAVDVCFDQDLKTPKLQPGYKLEDYRLFAETARAHGLEAGFFWKSPVDGPHIQLPLSSKNITLTMCRGLHAKGGIKSVWALLDKNGPWTTS